MSILHILSYFAVFVSGIDHYYYKDQRHFKGEVRSVAAT